MFDITGQMVLHGDTGGDQGMAMARPKKEQEQNPVLLKWLLAMKDDLTDFCVFLKCVIDCIHESSREFVLGCSH